MSKVSKSFVPLAMSASSSSEDEAKKSSSSSPNKSSRREEVAKIMPKQHSQKKGVNNNTDISSISSNNNSQRGCNVSPIPTPRWNQNNNNNHHRAIMMYGQLTPAGRSMTPTCQGRVKAPPICSAPALQKVASDVSELTDNKICFSLEQAESCAVKARLLWNNGVYTHSLQQQQQQHLHGVGGDACDGNEVPLNIDGIGEYWKIHAESAAAAAEVKAYVSSSSTVVTNTSASSMSMCGGGGRGEGSVMGTVASSASVAGGGSTTTPIMKKDRPPLEVVRTDNEDSLVVHSEDEHNPHPAAATSNVAAATYHSSSVLPLSRDFTDNLVKGNSSRQGRSLQRWLVHSQTEELVRQVAGTVPITRDGRIVLVSASRKSEWILPKGGWDADETREECAARETYEEAGLLGRLGACLDPIDYETSKAKKRRLNMMLGEGGGESGGAGGEVSRPPLPKRIKKVGEGGSSYSPTGPELTEEGTGKSRSKNASGSSPKKKSSNSDAKNYSYVRLLLFPLYVSEVKNVWPEKGRLRKLVDIDEAIKIMEKEDRGYFKRGLEMIKDRGLHLLKPDSLEDNVK
eukprot:CAMPEP_0113392156 /NCGR_PEP_ID=MMETSP0013_2-20120614/11123_1 /TAXON_ID=2843 ORGANISM="Skeletonema costatum, Strain 1716" /NCGR_SAMPLE_ID=MMETSP0013_2 /ASSEMBLY_ACC=CAM_ASM_000158 /LENGTH=571 /DNA_ID=CAMNT_0000275507 /DNA_START=476 /DNA_END=2191 /DNA_ORIENTATION=+ /assembly_acc=CAM_ASM_000158